MKRRNIRQTGLFPPLKRRATSEISRVARGQFHSPSPSLLFPPPSLSRPSSSTVGSSRLSRIFSPWPPPRRVTANRKRLINLAGQVNSINSILRRVRQYSLYLAATLCCRRTATRLPFFRMDWKMFKDASLTRERDLSREGTNYRILKGCCQHAAAVFVVRGWEEV